MIAEITEGGMLRLVFVSGRRTGDTFDLPEAGEVTVGRAPEATLRFDPGEVVVSSHHATITVRGGRVYLRDDESRNGTFVEGQRVAECELHPGQTVRFGSSGPSARLEVRETRPATELATPDRGRSSRSSGLTALYVEAREQVAAGAGGQPRQTEVMKAFVKLAQERSGRRFRLLLAGVGLAGAVAVALVFWVGERQAEALRGQVTAMSEELRAQGEARTALEAQLQKLADDAASSQGRADSLVRDLQRNRAEFERQRLAAARERESVQSDRRFGPAVTERYAAGVGIVEFTVGWRNPSMGWLHLRGTPDGKLSLTTDQTHELAVLYVSQCTGFLVDRVGWVLTNRHCVDLEYPSAEEVERQSLPLGQKGEHIFRPAIASWRIVFPPGKVFEVDNTTVLASREHDLGLFRTRQPPSGVPVLPLARDVKVVAGEDVVLLAYPGGTEATARRGGLGSFVDPSMGDQVQAAAERAVAEFIRRARAENLRLPEEAKALEALARSDVGVYLYLRSARAVVDRAVLDATARAGQVQPDVSGNMSVSGVTRTALSYHTLAGIGGSSGGPLIGTNLSVIGVNHAGWGDTDRGTQYQTNNAVPIEFAWRFLPAGIGKVQ